jgi:hypothetical protein
MEHLGVYPKRPVSRHANTIQKENTIVEKTINTLSHHFIPSPGFTHSLINQLNYSILFMIILKHLLSAKFGGIRFIYSYFLVFFPFFW